MKASFPHPILFTATTKHIDTLCGLSLIVGGNSRSLVLIPLEAMSRCPFWGYVGGARDTRHSMHVRAHTVMWVGLTKQAKSTACNKKNIVKKDPSGLDKMLRRTTFISLFATILAHLITSK